MADIISERLNRIVYSMDFQEMAEQLRLQTSTESTRQREAFVAYKLSGLIKIGLLEAQLTDISSSGEEDGTE